MPVPRMKLSLRKVTYAICPSTRAENCCDAVCIAIFIDYQEAELSVIMS